MGYLVPASTDPRHVSMNLFSDEETVKFGSSCSYVNFEGVNFLHQNNAVQFNNGAHHITIKNARILGGKGHIQIHDNVHDLVFDGITMDDAAPPWIAWTDIKSGTKPAEHLKTGSFNMTDGAYNVEILNCTISNSFDAVAIANTAHNVHIHHNKFLGIRDDVVQLGSNSYNIEINHNHMIFVSKGVSWHGSGTPVIPGTKYIHHNIIDCSRSMLSGRNDPQNLLPAKRHGPNNDGMVWARPFGKHVGSGFGDGDPWNIYNNTIIFGQEVNNLGAGHVYPLSSFDANFTHMAINNIIIQTMDHWIAQRANVSDGSQIFDGNLYYRSASNPKSPFFKEWKGNSCQQSFINLAEFKTSQLYLDSKSHYGPGFESSSIEADPQLDDDYYPSSDGPAAHGAIALPAGWPGGQGVDYRGALAPRNQGKQPSNELLPPVLRITSAH
jgi:hypothetical protein